MELTQQNFTQHLLTILEHLANADFVAIDFEFSGIKVKPARTVMEQTSLGPTVPEGRPSIQERYEEIKEVAEKYAIFQVGFTIGEQDKKNGGYILRPYNAHLNPLIVHRMDVDRDCTVSSSAAVFLQKNHFEIDKPFSQGVPYLSREEHRRAVLLESERLDGLNVGDLDFDKLDPQATKFLAETRKRIAAWSPKNKSDYLPIASPRGFGQPFEMLYRRIVHQLVRKEFKQFLTTTASNMMKVIIYDEPNEARHKHTKLEAFFSRISRQAGLRWVVEAMVGGDLSDLSVSDLYLTEGATWIDLDAKKKQFSLLADKLRARRPVLIGHNPFTDLVYLYRTFIGPLPDTVAEFSRQIHHLFPMIVDTKYLATHHGVMENSSLMDLSDEYKLQPFPLTRESPMSSALPVAPVLQQMPKHEARRRGRRSVPLKNMYKSAAAANQNTKAVAGPDHQHDYESRHAMHEAGYDSYLTAKLAVKASAKLAVSFQWRQKLKQPEAQRKRFRASVVRNLPDDMAQLLGVEQPAKQKKSKSKEKKDDDEEEALIDFSSSGSSNDGSVDNDGDNDGDYSKNDANAISPKRGAVVATKLTSDTRPIFKVPTAPAAMLAASSSNNLKATHSSSPTTQNIPALATTIHNNPHSHPLPTRRTSNHSPKHESQHPPQDQHPSLREKAYQPNAIFTPADLARSRATATPLLLDLWSVLPRPQDPAGADPGRWQLVADIGLPRWMPEWRSDFWLVFGNKLRVNGTLEGVVDLLGKP